MKKYIIFLTMLCAFSLVSACREQDPKPKTTDQIAAEKKENKAPSKQEPERLVSEVDVEALANRSAAAFDDLFGEPVKITKIRDQPNLMPGEFRQYQIEGHPKGLSVRFYKDRAKRFNLLLGSPERSAEESLLKLFKIDVKKMNRVNGDLLSETWKGRSGKINFETAYAKRDKSGGEFVLLHAEITK